MTSDSAQRTDALIRALQTLPFPSVNAPTERPDLVMEHFEVMPALDELFTREGDSAYFNGIASGLGRVLDAYTDLQGVKVLSGITFEDIIAAAQWRRVADNPDWAGFREATPEWKDKTRFQIGFLDAVATALFYTLYPDSEAADPNTNVPDATVQLTAVPSAEAPDILKLLDATDTEPEAPVPAQPAPAKSEQATSADISLETLAYLISLGPSAAKMTAQGLRLELAAPVTGRTLATALIAMERLGFKTQVLSGDAKHVVLGVVR